MRESDRSETTLNEEQTTVGLITYVNRYLYRFIIEKKKILKTKYVFIKLSTTF